MKKEDEFKIEYKKIYDFNTSDKHCLCESRINEQLVLNKSIHSESSSSEDEEDFFESFLPVFDKYKNEFENLFAPIEPIAEALTRLKFDFRGMENMKIIDFIADVENFFVHKIDTKVTQLKACPNSLFPILPRNPNEEDFPPTYLTDLEFRKFLRPFNPNNKYFDIRRNGLYFMYDSQRKFDFQTNFVLGSRLFYTKIFNDRLSKTRLKDEKHTDINLPISLYEPKTLIKRFTDIFVFFPYVFEDFFYSKKLSENYILCKTATAIIAGIHKFVSSQGIPLTALIGETYETKMNNFYLFAEVRKDKNPAKILYNIRFMDRSITVNGFVEIWWDFLEIEDKVKVKIASYNKMEVDLVNRDKEVYEFILPYDFVIQGIIEEIKSELVRVINVQSFFLIRGPTKSAFMLFNSIEDQLLYKRLAGLVADKVSSTESLFASHYSLGLIFNNSHLNFNFTPEEAVKPPVNLDNNQNNNKNGETPKEDSTKKSKFNLSNYNNTEIKSFIKLVKDLEGNYDLLFTNLLSNNKADVITNVIIGSWLDLNFYQFDFNEKSVKLLQFKNIMRFENGKYTFLKVDTKAEHLKNNFLHNQDHVASFGKEMWEKVKIPIPSDTRYREDLIWLMRYFRYIKSSGKEIGNKSDLEKNKQEALKLATRWKQLLEGFTLIFIKKK